MSEPTPTPGAAAGTPNGLSPSGATSPGGTPPERPRPDDADVAGEQRQVPGQPPGTVASPVPSPGDVPGASLPGVAAGEGASPDDGISQGDKGPDSDSSVASPGSFVALAPPGHPDGEVDTRVR